MRNWRALDAPTYFLLASRLNAYGGVISARVQALDEDGGTITTQSGAINTTRIPDDAFLAMAEREGWAEHGE